MTSPVFFVISKLVGLLILVETWLILILILSLVARWRGWFRLANGAQAAVLAALLALTALPGGGLGAGPAGIALSGQSTAERPA